MNKAIVTLAIGDPYTEQWNTLCKENWGRYASKRGYDIICIDTPLDSSTRAKSRSPAWQKCLVLSQPWSEKYERIVWVDADILMNPYAPDVSEGVPLEKVGAADEYSYPTAELHQIALDRFYKYLRSTGASFLEEYTGQQYHANYGLPAEFNKVVQTGVLVFNPKYHRKILENIYQVHEDKPGPLWGEMRAVSYELQKENIVHWIDPRFNALCGIYFALYRPYSVTRTLNESKFGRPIRRIYHSRFEKLFARIYSRFGRLFAPAADTDVLLKSAYINNYFLHFAACKEDLPRLKWKDIDLSS